MRAIVVEDFGEREDFSIRTSSLIIGSSLQRVFIMILCTDFIRSMRFTSCSVREESETWLEMKETKKPTRPLCKFSMNFYYRVKLGG